MITKFKDILELNKKLNAFDYGLIINGIYDKRRNTTASDWDKYYRLATPLEFLKRKVGTCWDYTTFEATLFKKSFPDIPFSSWYIVFDNQDDMPTHTFITFKYDSKYYWFESSFKAYCGIWESDREVDILNAVLTYMDKYGGVKNPRKPLLGYPFYIFKYDASDPKLYHATCEQFMHMAEDIQVPHKYNPNFRVQKISIVKENTAMNIDEMFDAFLESEINEDQFTLMLTEAMISKTGCQPFTEGTNTDCKEIFRENKKDIKASIKKLKSMAVKGDPKDEAEMKAEAKKCRELIKATKTDMNKTPGTIPSTIISFLIVNIVDLLKWTIPTILTFGVAGLVLEIKRLIEFFNGIVKGVKGEEDWVDALNQVKQRYDVALNLMDQAVSAAEKTYTKKREEKSAKDTKESVEMKLKIYESFMDGSITEAQRDLLLEKLG